MHLVLCWCRGPTYMEGKMTYPEFVWFLLSEEDKKHPRRWIYVPFIFYQFTVIKQIVGSCKVEPPCFVMVSENLPRHKQSLGFTVPLWTTVSYVGPAFPVPPSSHVCKRVQENWWQKKVKTFLGGVGRFVWCGGKFLASFKAWFQLVPSWGG